MNQEKEKVVVRFVCAFVVIMLIWAFVAALYAIVSM